MNQQEQPPVIPVRLQRYEPESEAPPLRRFWLNPLSAGLILGVDWFFFAGEVGTAGLALPLTCTLAFVSTFIGVYWIQRNKSGDPRSAAFVKALFGGMIAGLPTSLGGTLVGTVVLLLAGLRGGSPGAVKK